MKETPPKTTGLPRLASLAHAAGLATAVLAAFAAGYGMVLLHRPDSPEAGPGNVVLPGVLYAVCVVLALALPALRQPDGDSVIPAVAMLLTGIGVIVRVRLGAGSTAPVLSPGLLALPVGCAAMVIPALYLGSGRVRALRNRGAWCYAGACAVMLVITVFGRRYRGTLFLPGNINPAELTKVLLPIWVAGVLAGPEEAPDTAPREGVPLKRLVVLFALWCVPSALIVLQRDLGMLVQLNAILLVMVYAATGRKALAVPALAGIAVLGALILSVARHALDRFEIWLHPFRDPTGKAWQVLQGLTAMYSGGLWGVGLGEGAPQYIPVAGSDFVYAVVGEELGFMGCLVVTAGFAVLLTRAFAAAFAERDTFTRLLGTGLGAGLAIQVVLNIGGVTKAIPLTGITLPFVSQGGSSLVATFALTGLLYAISACPAPVPPPPGRRELRREALRGAARRRRQP